MVAKSGAMTKSLEMRPFVSRYLPEPTGNSSVGVVIRVTSQSRNGSQWTTVAHNATNSTYPVAIVTR